MAYEFKLQDPGEGIHEAEIIEVVVSKGDHVGEGDNVLVVETDKAAVDIPSPVTGDIVEIRVDQGDIAKVGDVLMLIDTGEEGSESEDAESAEPAEEKEKPETGKDKGASEDEKEDADQPKSEDSGNQAKADGPEPQEDSTTEEESEPKDEERASGDEPEEEKDEARTKATPAVRKLAKDLGVDLASVSGSGEDGRILEEDVRKRGDVGKEKKATPSDAPEGQVEIVELHSVKRAMAKRMARAWSEIPHVVHNDEIDITRLEDVRTRHNEDAGSEGELTLTPFLIKALAGTLHEHPHFNAAFDSEAKELQQFATVNMGVALDTERGLLVPVLRDADRKSVVELAAELRKLAEEIRNDRPRGEALKGATFTLTNIGSIGGTGFSPIISPPQVAIFGSARSRLQQVFSGTPERHESRVALILPVCIAFDHRVIDGAEAARFMNAVKALLADPVELMLHS